MQTELISDSSSLWDPGVCCSPQLTKTGDPVSPDVAAAAFFFCCAVETTLNRTEEQKKCLHTQVRVCVRRRDRRVSGWMKGKCHLAQDWAPGDDALSVKQTEQRAEIACASDQRKRSG